MSERWDRHFLEMARLHSRLSKDPNTRVGSIIVNPDNLVLGTGFNGFPRNITDDARLFDKETKLKIIVHAEMNAALAAARLGIRIQGATMYTSCTDDSGAIWGGPPCTRCAAELIQTGISKVIAYESRGSASTWHEDLLFAQGLLEEAGIELVTYPVHKAAAEFDDDIPF